MDATEPPVSKGTATASSKAAAERKARRLEYLSRALYKSDAWQPAGCHSVGEIIADDAEIPAEASPPSATFVSLFYLLLGGRSRYESKVKKFTRRIAHSIDKENQERAEARAAGGAGQDLPDIPIPALPDRIPAAFAARLEGVITPMIERAARQATAKQDQQIERLEKENAGLQQKIQAQERKMAEQASHLHVLEEAVLWARERLRDILQISSVRAQLEKRCTALFQNIPAPLDKRFANRAVDSTPTPPAPPASSVDAPPIPPALASPQEESPLTQAQDHSPSPAGSDEMAHPPPNEDDSPEEWEALAHLVTAIDIPPRPLDLLEGLPPDDGDSPVEWDALARRRPDDDELSPSYGWDPEEPDYAEPEEEA